MRRHCVSVSRKHLLCFGKLYPSISAVYTGAPDTSSEPLISSFRALVEQRRFALVSVVPPVKVNNIAKSPAQIRHERRMEEAKARKAEIAKQKVATVVKSQQLAVKVESVPTRGEEAHNIQTSGQVSNDQKLSIEPLAHKNTSVLTDANNNETGAANTLNPSTTHGDVNFSDDSSLPKEGLTPVKDIDVFAKSRIQNYLKKWLTDHDPSNVSADRHHHTGDISSSQETFSATYGISDVARAFSTSRNSTSSSSSEGKVNRNLSWRTDVRVPVKRPDGSVMVVHGVGYAADEKSSSVVAAMHAERCLDEIGVQIFTLPRMQQRYAETARLQGRFAPLPNDPQRRDEDISIPYPLVHDATLTQNPTEKFAASKPAGIKAFVGSSDHLARLQREKEAREKKKYAIRYACDPFGSGIASKVSNSTPTASNQDLLKDLREGKFFTDVQNEGGEDEENEDFGASRAAGLGFPHQRKSDANVVVGGIHVPKHHQTQNRIGNDSVSSSRSVVDTDGSEVLEVSFVDDDNDVDVAPETVGRVAGRPHQTHRADAGANFGNSSHRQSQVAGLTAQDPNRKLLQESDARSLRSAAKHSDKVGALEGLVDETEGGYFNVVDDQEYISPDHTTFSYSFLSKVAVKNIEQYIRSYYRIERAIQLREAEAELGSDGQQSSSEPATSTTAGDDSTEFAYLHNDANETLTKRLDRFLDLGTKLGMPELPTFSDLVSISECEGVVTVSVDMRTDVVKWYTATMLVPGINVSEHNEGEVNATSASNGSEEKFPNRPKFPYTPGLAMGRALSKERAVVLCAMHAESIIDLYGLPLFPENDDMQRDHVESCLSYGRWAVSPEEYVKGHKLFEAEMADRNKKGLPLLLLPSSEKANLSDPKPLKEWKRILHRSGSKSRHRVSNLNDEEKFLQLHRLFITRHRMHISEFGLIRNVDDINDLDLCKKLIKEFIADAPLEHMENRRNCFVNFDYSDGESQVRCSILLPLPKQYGLRGGYAIGCSQHIAEGLAALHAIDTLCALCIPVSKDPQVQADLVARRKAQGRIVPLAKPSEVHPLMRSPPGYRETPDTTARPPIPGEVWRVMLLDSENFDCVKSLGRAEPLNWIASRVTNHSSFDMEVHKFDHSKITFQHAAAKEANLLAILKQIIVNYFIANNIDDRGLHSSDKINIIGSMCSHYNGHQRKGAQTSVPANNYWMTLPVPQRFGRRVAWGRCVPRKNAMKALLIHIVRILFTLGLYPNERPVIPLISPQGQPLANHFSEARQTIFPGARVQKIRESAVEYNPLRVSPDGSLIPELAAPMPYVSPGYAYQQTRFLWDTADWELWCSLPDGILSEPRGSQQQQASPQRTDKQTAPTSEVADKYIQQGARVTYADDPTPVPQSQTTIDLRTEISPDFKGHQGIYNGKVWLANGTIVDETKFPAAWAMRVHRETLEKMTGGLVPDNIPTPNPVTTSVNFDILFNRKY